MLAWERYVDAFASGSTQAAFDSTTARDSGQVALISDTDWQSLSPLTQDVSPDSAWGVRHDRAQGTLQLYDPVLPDDVVTISHPEVPEYLVFSPDGRWLAGAAGSFIRVFALRRDDIIQQACRRLPFGLDEEDWAELLGGDKPPPRACRRYGAGYRKSVRTARDRDRGWLRFRRLPPSVGAVQFGRTLR